MSPAVSPLVVLSDSLPSATAGDWRWFRGVQLTVRYSLLSYMFSVVVTRVRGFKFEPWLVSLGFRHWSVAGLHPARVLLSPGRV